MFFKIFPGYKSDSLAARGPIEQGDQLMSKHVTISPKEAADRLAIRELVEAYAHCADRRDAKGQMSLFTEDTHFVVYMNAKDPTPSQELHSREELASVFAELNKYDATTHFLGQSTIFHADGRSRHRGNLLPGASHHGRRWKASLDARLAPLFRHVREDGGRVAFWGASALRRLAGRARTVMRALATDVVVTIRFLSLESRLKLGDTIAAMRSARESFLSAFRAYFGV